MACVHLQQLFQLCQDNDVKVASVDLVHFVCEQCDSKEVCPSVLADEYDARELDQAEPNSSTESGQ